MGTTLAETIRAQSRQHLESGNGLLFGQCVTAVGWVGGTVPEMSEKEGIVELPMVDVAGPGMAVGAALMGRRPIFVCRYQGFMWYNAPTLVNYAAKSRELWGVPCPIFVRSLAMEGGMGPVASASHHGLIMRMPGIAVCAPMTPGEWMEAWDWFMAHDDPIYVSEHRRGFSIDYEIEDAIEESAEITLFPITATRLNALEARERLGAEGIGCNIIHLMWLKPFVVTSQMKASLEKTGLGMVLDSDFEVGGPARGLAHELMLTTSTPVHAMGLEERTAGFAPHLDNGTPSVERIVSRVKELVHLKRQGGQPLIRS